MLGNDEKHVCGRYFPVSNGTEGTRRIGMGEEEGEIVWDEEKVDEDNQEEYHQPRLTAKRWNVRRLLQVKIHQFCLKSG